MEKPDEVYWVDDGKPKFGATDGAGKIGVPGPTLGTPQALPPGYTVNGTAVVPLAPKYMILDVVSVEVKPDNEL